MDNIKSSLIKFVIETFPETKFIISFTKFNGTISPTQNKLICDEFESKKPPNVDTKENPL